MFITIFIFIIILGLLVFVHELGHFIAAKKSGMAVEEFGFGFPPRMFGMQKTEGKWKAVWGHKSVSDRDRTVYSVNWIPLGGFVKIRGENNEHEGDPRSFINRPFSGRLLTLVAGVTMNVLLAFVIYSIGFAVGLPAAVEKPSDVPPHAQFANPKIAVVDVTKNLPADRAGLLMGDVIVSLDGRTFGSVEEIRNYIRERAGSKFVFQTKRGSREEKVEVSSDARPAPGEGPTGIALASVGALKFPLYLAVWEGAKNTIQQLGAIASGLWQLLSGNIGLSAVGGPVKIAQLTGQVAHLGLAYLTQFTAFLSLNLAVLNILPFPALDGGRVLFLLIEKMRGKRNNQKIEQWFNTAGFVFLLLLMIVVTVKDIVKK